MDTANPRFEELKKLMEEKDSLVKEGKYLEAEEIRRKILSIKTDSSSQKKGSLHSLQVKQRQTLEDEYKTERKELEEKWDKKIQEFVELGKKQDLKTSIFSSIIDIERQRRSIFLPLISFPLHAPY